jgi:hypothetical protein
VPLWNVPWPKEWNWCARADLHFKQRAQTGRVIVYVFLTKKNSDLPTILASEETAIIIIRLFKETRGGLRGRSLVQGKAKERLLKRDVPRPRSTAKKSLPLLLTQRSGLAEGR